MKIINYKNILSTVFISLINTVHLTANNPPIPVPRGGGGFDDSVVVGGPIDNYLPLLFFMASVFGMWAINRNNTKCIY